MPKFERIKKRHLLKKSVHRREVKNIERILETPFTGLDPKERFEEGYLDDDSRVLLLNDTIIFFEYKNLIVPTIHALLDNKVKLPEVTVDMGAVRYVVNGADIMRPGITKIDEGIQEGSIVAIVDERHGKPLAIGISKLNTEDMRAAESGKVVQSIHYVNDDLWDFSKDY
ncbi:MAG: RNA-binding protein [Candidatus Thorarchaeota archaeon]|jgi:PUA domain protein